MRPELQTRHIERANSQPAPAPDVQRSDIRTDKHAGDCTIYALGGTLTAGICVCGYGWRCWREGDCSQLYAEWKCEKPQPMQRSIVPNAQYKPGHCGQCGQALGPDHWIPQVACTECAQLHDAPVCQPDPVHRVREAWLGCGHALWHGDVCRLRDKGEPCICGVSGLKAALDALEGGK